MPPKSTETDYTRPAAQSKNEHWFTQLIRACARRRVNRTLLSYGVILWINVQIGDILFPMLGFPAWALQLVVIVGLMGLPVVTFLAWTYQLTPHKSGMQDDESESDDKSPSFHHTALDIGMISVGVLIVVLLTIDIVSHFGGC